ncbi:MAG: hypothetical protein WC979_01660 [Candidatus Pacearchaeota archaeon]|jgi:hypothetical protein|nr:hypothetical protein [Clostridia bacterium]
MDSKSIIRSLSEPTLTLDELKVIDTQYGSNGDVPKANRSLEAVTVDCPYVVIKEHEFGVKEIVSFEIDTTQFIPTVSMRIDLGASGAFLSTAFPTDGDLLSVFIRGRDDIFKPIRNDYLITSIEMTKSDTPDGAGGKLFLQGKLHIPGLYDEKSFAKKGTSFEVLKEIATELKLGFASNISSTNDSMTWICPNETKEEYIKKIVDCAWQDEKCFFTAFIDVYYHLNFINVNTQFGDETGALLGMSDNVFSSYNDTLPHTTEGLQKLLSNHPSFITTSFYIQTFKPLNKSSEIAKNYGYTYNLNFFEHNSLKNWEFPITPLVTEGNEKTKVLLKGRPKEEFYKSQQRFNYLGIQYSAPDHNVHEHYYLAKAHNMMNLAEIDKMNLSVTTPKMNLNFVRFEKMPVIMAILSDEQRANKVDDDLIKDPSLENREGRVVIDKLYTGMYAIKGYTINYKLTPRSIENTNSNITQTFILTRREWPSLTGV